MSSEPAYIRNLRLLSRGDPDFSQLAALNAELYGENDRRPGRDGRGGRCLIPFDMFYEWSGEKGKKTKHTITVQSNRPYAFAGLWAAWPAAPADKRRPYLSAAIVTVTPNDQMRAVHNRMPAILDESLFGTWLGEEGGAADVQGLLRPWAGALEVREAL